MRIDAKSLLSIKPELSDMLKNLQAGDTLKGRVMESLGSTIAIKTLSGQIFTAVLMEGVRLQKGDMAELTIRSIADGSIFAELKSEAGSEYVGGKVSEILKQLGMPVNDKNTEAAKLLIKYKLPVNKEVIANITSLQKSIDNLNQSREGRAALLLSGLDINNTPADVLNKIVLSWPKELMNQAAVENAPAEAQNAPNSGAGPQEMAHNELTEAAVPGTESEKYAHKKDIMASNEAIMGQKVVSAEADRDNAKAMPMNDTEINNGAELVEVMKKLRLEGSSEMDNLAKRIGDILNLIKDTDMEGLVYLISKNMAATPKNLGQLMKNIKSTDGISKLLDKLQSKLEEFNSPELKELKASIKKVFLELRSLEDTDEVSEQLKDIVKLGEKLESCLRNSGIKDPEIRDALSGLKDNIDFIRSINEHSNYIQLPVLINRDTSTAKLYVFKEGKRNKAVNPEDATILIALDLKNLGHIESLVGVKGKLVNVTFRVENKAIGSMLEKTSISLKNALMGKGYSLASVKVINLEQAFNLLTLEEMINEGNSEKIHFDMRI